jgi:alpha-galactosidase
MYPHLRRAVRDPKVYEADPVRFEVPRHFGTFVTESIGHFTEYVPRFRKRPDLLKRCTRAGYLGESGFYANHWKQWRVKADETIRAGQAGESETNLKRSGQQSSTATS